MDSFVENDCIIIVLKRSRKTGVCPSCGKRCRFIHRYRKRRVRDLDVATSKVFLEFVSCQLDCRCGFKGYEHLDFVEEYSRYTKRFEEKVVVLCQKMCIKDAASEMRIGWEAAKSIDKRYAQRHIADLKTVSPTRMGVDEVAYEKGHNYLTVVRDLDLGKVVWVGTGRKKETLDAFFKELGIEKSWRISVAVCDMWDPYIASIQAHTNAAIVFDKFHIAKYITNAVDHIRRQEFAKADHTERKLMKKKRFLILARQQRLDDAKRETLQDLLLLNSNLSAAYILKEQALDIFDEQHIDNATKRLTKWFANITTAGLQPLINAAQTIKNYLYGVLNYFLYHVTNAASEGFNNKINVIKRRAYGFRDLEYFKLKILQNCGQTHHHIP